VPNEKEQKAEAGRIMSNLDAFPFSTKERKRKKEKKKDLNPSPGFAAFAEGAPGPVGGTGNPRVADTLRLKKKLVSSDQLSSEKKKKTLNTKSKGGLARKGAHQPHARG